MQRDDNRLTQRTQQIQNPLAVGTAEEAVLMLNIYEIRGMVIDETRDALI